MKNLTILTVQEYNASQSSMCMMMQTTSGSLRKSGFVVYYDDTFKYCKTLKEAEKTTHIDFIKCVYPGYEWGYNTTNLEALNA